MNVLMICERFPPEVGGLACSGGRIASSLHRIGCKVHVLAWSRNLPPGLVQSEEVEGVVLHRMGRFSNWDLTLQHSLNVLGSLHEKHSFDLTWGHYLQVAGFLAVIFARSEKLRSVVSARGNDIDQLMFPPGDFARLKWTLEQASLVTSVSSELAKKIRLLAGDDFQVTVLPNVVDLEVFSPREPEQAMRKELGIEPEEIIIGFSGELRHKKGLPFLPGALAEVRRNRPASLLVIGEIRARERSTLSGFAAEDPQTAARILSTGHLEQPVEVAKRLSLCDLIVQPSVWDGMPNSVMEAMACECLVLASDAGGIPEVVTHGANGALISKTKLNRLGEAVIEVLELPADQRQRMQRAARRTIAENFSEEVEECALRTVLQKLGH
ncbi:MAG: glycosyltransferase family 4 protein [Verrucomicrobiaceae bacterium]|nr:glycosyltransferase family 4 protein [Verrucomicrobiaceae bacterium]